MCGGPFLSPLVWAGELVCAQGRLLHSRPAGAQVWGCVYQEAQLFLRDTPEVTNGDPWL